MFAHLPTYLRPFHTAWTGYFGAVMMGAIGLGGVLLAKGYEGSFLLLHQSWGPFWDQMMPHLTHIGDGTLVAGLICVVAFRKQEPLLCTMILALLLLSAAVALLKHGIFMDWHRPGAVLAPDQVRELSLGRERMRSFPSGHSAVAGCIGFFAATLTRSRVWGFLLGMSAWFVGFTRVYIGAHFPADVLAGFMVGILMSILALWIGGFAWRAADRMSPQNRSIWSWIMFAVGILLLISSVQRLLSDYYL